MLSAFPGNLRWYFLKNPVCAEGPEAGPLGKQENITELGSHCIQNQEGRA